VKESETMSEDEKQASPNELKKGLADVRENLTAIIEYQAAWSIMLKARYDALLGAGFDKKQALDIVKTRGMGG